jgi:hypothetical protein
MVSLVRFTPEQQARILERARIAREARHKKFHDDLERERQEKERKANAERIRIRVEVWAVKVNHNFDLFSRLLVETYGERNSKLDCVRAHPLTDRIVK